MAETQLLTFSTGATIALSRDGNLITATATPTNPLPPLDELIPLPEKFAPFGNVLGYIFNTQDLMVPGTYSIFVVEVENVGYDFGIGFGIRADGPYVTPIVATWDAEIKQDAPVENSILHDIKIMLGQEWDDPTYDLDIKNHINTVFFNLNQIGVGPAEGFMIQDESTLWPAYIGAKLNLNSVKTYIWLRVKMVFDPPQTGPMMESLQKQADKLEWTLMVEVDPPRTTESSLV